VTDEKCVINVLREGGTDGKISCRWKTVELQSNHSAAQAGIDFIPKEGVIEFVNEQAVAIIDIEICQHPEENLVGEVNKCFAVQLSKPSVKEVKIKTPLLVIELVKDQRSKKQADAV